MRVKTSRMETLESIRSVETRDCGGGGTYLSSGETQSSLND